MTLLTIVLVLFWILVYVTNWYEVLGLQHVSDQCVEVQDQLRSAKSDLVQCLSFGRMLESMQDNITECLSIGRMLLAYLRVLHP